MKKYFYEAVVIVSSILLAFGINTLWDEINEKSRQNALIEALRSDMVASKKQYDFIVGRHIHVQKSLEEILTWAENGTIPEDDLVRFDSLIGSTFNRQIFDPTLGSIDAILSSGRFDIIEDLELISQLTRWKSQVQNLRELESARTEHFYTYLYPYLSKKVNLQDLDKGIPTTIPWFHDKTQTYLLISETEFINIIYMHWVLQWNIQLELPEIDETFERIFKILEED
jgi:hypothetical protein